MGPRRTLSAMSEDERRKQCEDLFGEVDEDFQNPVVPRPGARPPALRTGPPQRPPDIALRTVVAWNRMGHRAKRRAARLHEHGGAPAVGPDELNDRLFMAIPARTRSRSSHRRSAVVERANTSPTGSSANTAAGRTPACATSAATPKIRDRPPDHRERLDHS